MKSLRKSKAFERKFAKFQRNFGAVIRDLRIKANLSRTELARRAKFSVGTLTKIEQGRGNPSIGQYGEPRDGSQPPAKPDIQDGAEQRRQW